MYFVFCFVLLFSKENFNSVLCSPFFLLYCSTYRPYVFLKRMRLFSYLKFHGISIGLMFPVDTEISSLFHFTLHVGIFRCPFQNRSWGGGWVAKCLHTAIYPESPKRMCQRMYLYESSSRPKMTWMLQKDVPTLMGG